MSIETGRTNLAIMKRTSQEEYAKYRHDFERCDASTSALVVDAMADRLDVTRAEASQLLAAEGWRSSFETGVPPEQALIVHSSTIGAPPTFGAALPPGATASRAGGFRDWNP